MTRIYAPLLADEVAELAAGRPVRLDRWFTAPAGLSGDALEEAEYDALVDAAAAGAERSGTGVRRVVVAADVDAPGSGPVDLAPRRVASYHVDETTEHSDEDLLWHDAAEADAVLALLRG